MAGLDGFHLSVMLLRNHTPTYLEQVNWDIQEVSLPLVMLTTLV